MGARFGELRDALADAGFSQSRVYWEAMEEDPEDSDMEVGSGEYEDVTEEPVENQASWLAYVVGVR